MIRMRIRLRMCNLIKSCLTLLLILLSGCLSISLEENSGEEKSFFRQIDEGAIESIWRNCGQDVNRVNEAVAELNLCLTWANDNGEKLSCMREIFLDCFRRKRNLFDGFGQDVFEIHYHKYLKFIFSFPNAPRRNLVSIPGLGPSPSPSPSPSPGIVNLAPKRSRVPPTLSRAPTPWNSFFPPDVNARSPSPAKKNSTFRPIKWGKGREDDKKTIIITVVLTAVPTFVCVALFLFCCYRTFGRASKGKQNDDRPLLSLSMNDHSFGSSPNYGGCVRGKKLGNQSFNIQLNQQKRQLYGAAQDGEINQGIAPLKPPPGRTVSRKVEPLPPEPPIFPKVPPSVAAAPPPPPPAPAPPPPRPLPPAAPPGPRPPPPPAAPGLKGPRPPTPLAPGLKTPRPASGSTISPKYNAPKTKLKPFFWDKVQANPDHSMVWNEIGSGSFRFNEEMIESLFGYAAADKNKGEKKDSSLRPALPQSIQILDPKKAQNLSILLRALNATTEEVCDALNEGNELPVEFLQALLKMAPTADEELKLRLYDGEITQLGPAERFLKALIDIPFAFKRLEAMLFMCTLHEEMAFVKESFATLEVACKELRSSRAFLKLLEAVLKTGNRMNDGTFRGGAQAFKLDTLLKLSDVMGTDGKTTLLHFVVQEIIRSEGVRAARTINEETEEKFQSLGLEKVSNLSNELENVKRAGSIDADGLTRTVHKMGKALSKARDFLNLEMKNSNEETGFYKAFKGFVQRAEDEIKKVVEEEKRIMGLVRSAGDYFHGNAGKDEGLRLFVIVGDFLIMLDKVCKEIKDVRRKPTKTSQKLNSTMSSISSPPSFDLPHKLFPTTAERRLDHPTSDSDSD